MEFKDYYKSLGLQKGADADAVKKAYRKLAAKYHPDKNPGSKTAEDRFKEINEANEVLSDPAKRKRYDELGADWNRQGPDGAYEGRGHGGAGPGGRGRSRTFTQEEMGDIFGGGGGGFSDFFETYFGGAGMGGGGPGRGRQGGAWGANMPRPGGDYQSDVEISLEEAYEGAKKIFEIDGKKLRLQFKPGIADGKVIKLAGKGGAGANGGPDGDFYLRIRVRPHPVFERRGDDLHITLPLEVQDAVVGKTEEIQTLAGGVKLRIPPATDNGKSFRLKGQGMPLYDKAGEHGDLYVTVNLVLPKDLKPDEIATFKEMAEARRK